MRLAPLAVTLPYDILVQIFADLSLDGRVEGGEVIEWTTNHHLATYSTVCRSWLRPAQAVLFRSVIIRGEAQARLFLRRTSEDHTLARSVRSLIIGLGDELENSKEETGQAKESQVLVQVLAACLDVEHLQVRPLHATVRTTLLTTIKNRKLISLVLAPSIVHGSKWTRGMWYANDHVHVLLPTLRYLEIDSWASPPADAALPNIAPLPALAIPLIELRLASAISERLLVEILVAAGPTLKFLDLYSEDAPSTNAMANALSHCAGLTYLRYISNPTFEQLNSFNGITPLFHQLFPHLRALATLSIAATDISTNFLRLLPPSLEELEVHSLSQVSTFFFDQELLDDLEDPLVPIHLKTLLVRDIAEVWESDEVEAVTRACARRGVDFMFLPDRY